MLVDWTGISIYYDSVKFINADGITLNETEKIYQAFNV